VGVVLMFSPSPGQQNVWAGHGIQGYQQGLLYFETQRYFVLYFFFDFFGFFWTCPSVQAGEYYL